MLYGISLDLNSINNRGLKRHSRDSEYCLTEYLTVDYLLDNQYIEVCYSIFPCLLVEVFYNERRKCYLKKYSFVLKQRQREI